jgi:hypothetical protein
MGIYILAAFISGLCICIHSYFDCYYYKYYNLASYYASNNLYKIRTQVSDKKKHTYTSSQHITHSTNTITVHIYFSAHIGQIP